MDRVAEYRRHIQRVLDTYGSFDLGDDGIELEIVSDTQHDHYQLVTVGWQGERRTYGCILHMDIKNDKIWIQHDGTEVGIANELVEMGVPKSAIVLAFHSPYKRPYTGFAVN